jgi:hypothetical protein
MRPPTKDNRFKDPKNTTGKFLGPGAYHIMDSVPNYKYKPTTSFCSTAPKVMLEADIKILKQDIIIPKNNNNGMDDDYETVPTTIPGPGTYYNSKRDSSFQRGQKTHKYQLFNSSVPRFPEAKYNSYIGPGTYDSRAFQKNAKKMQQPKPQVPFNSESLREYELEKNKEDMSPGPGAYDHPYDMAKIIGKKVEMARKRRRRAKSEMPLKEN